MATPKRPISVITLIDTEAQVDRFTSPALQAKPLPRLPRGWTRVRHETCLFLRSIGLGIVISYISGLRRDFSEPSKVAVSRTRLTAILRSLIHVVPMGIGFMEIIFNWKGRYVGAEFSQQFFLQFAAKAHEITIDASLTFIVLSYIRHMLTFGDGLPFGVFLGGLQFLQISYLWSAEFWSSITSQKITWKNRICVFFIIAATGILAATVGPSSATLLIPRQTPWPLRSSHFLINGTFQDIWPDQVDVINIPDECAALPAFESNSLCPAGDWYRFIQELNNDTFTYWNMNSHLAPATEFLIVDTENDIGRLMVVTLCLSSPHDQACGSIQQSVITAAAHDSNVKRDLHNSADGGDISFEVNSQYNEPYTLTSCVSNIVTNDTYSQPLQFPVISETQSELMKERTTVSVLGMTPAKFIEAPGNASEFRLEWVDLPQELFNETVIGAVLSPPQGITPVFPINITACTIGAGWGTSALTTDFATQDFSSYIDHTPKSFPLEYSEIGSGELVSAPNYANLSGFAYPQRRIALSKDWAGFLNPAIIISENYNTTVMNLFLAFAEAPRETSVAHLLTAMLTMGLARIGNELEWQDISSNPKSCDDCLVFEMKYFMTGWAYTMQGTTTKLAVAVILIYCLLAFAHVLYLGVSGVSSTAWDSTAEVVALAMNSAPTKYLQNTCAGIIGIKTFRTNVRILATNGGKGKEEHLELVFGDLEHSGAPRIKMEADVEYGRLRED